MNKPVFSGEWRFDKQASERQIGTPDDVEFRILHDEPRFGIERTLSIAGQQDTFAIDMVVGEQNPPFNRGPVTVLPSLIWDGITWCSVPVSGHPVPNRRTSSATGWRGREAR